jgi:membrane fusion protein
VLSNLQRQQQESEARLSALQFEYGQKMVELEQEEAALADEELRLSQQEIQQLAEHRIEIRAPVSGHIGSLAIHRGTSLAAGERMLTLVPRDSRLVAELAIPSHAMGFVSKGQAINLHIDAYPYQKFGVRHGRVLDFDTATILQPARPGQMPVAEYRLVAELENQSVSAYGSEHALLAGMELSADIQLDRRTLLEWLFEPLLSAGR